MLHLDMELHCRGVIMTLLKKMKSTLPWWFPEQVLVFITYLQVKINISDALVVNENIVWFNADKSAVYGVSRAAIDKASLGHKSMWKTCSEKQPYFLVIYVYITLPTLHILGIVVFPVCHVYDLEVVGSFILNIIKTGLDWSSLWTIYCARDEMAGFFDLKDEQQAKEYIDRVGVEYRFQCYSEGRADGCHRLADYFEAFKHQYDNARKVYAKNCDENRYGISCFKLGNYNFLGKACKKDFSAAFDAYRRGCEYGSGPSCYNAALLMEDGRGNADGRKDFVAATEFLRSGCNVNDAPACFRLSTFYITGKDGVESDMKQAFSYAKMACDKDHIVACHNLSRMYAQGQGTEQSQELADFYHKKAKELYKTITEGTTELKFGE